METKLIEVRDRATRLHVMAILLAPDNPGDSFILDSSGWGCGGAPIAPFVLMVDLDRVRIWRDPVETAHATDPGRTFGLAHHELKYNWSHYKSGDVLDVEFVLGETEIPKRSDRLYNPLGGIE